MAKDSLPEIDREKVDVTIDDSVLNIRSEHSGVINPFGLICVNIGNTAQIGMTNLLNGIAFQKLNYRFIQSRCWRKLLSGKSQLTIQGTASSKVDTAICEHEFKRG